MSDHMLRRSFEADVRSLDEEHRSATFVASTERAVPMPGGAEVLRMSGARLQRYRKNPVVLDSHNRHGLDSVIGKSDVKVDKEKRELHATIQYAPTPAGEQAWALVRGGFVRAVSIGYAVNPRSVRRLRDGETDGEGDAQITGPASIVREWELFEVSNVPVPADQDAVRRAFYDSIPLGEKEPVMDKLTRAMGDSTPPETAAPAPTTSTANVANSVVRLDELAEERAARSFEAKKRQVLAFTPRGLEAEAEACLLEGLDVEATRRRLLEIRTARLKPVGTPEPKEAPKAPEGATASRQWPAEVTDDVLAQSLKRAF